MTDRYTRARPKRLRRDGAVIGFELDAHQFLVDLNTRPIQRPLPAIHTLLAAAPQRGKSCTDRHGHIENRTQSDHSKIPLLVSFTDELQIQFGVEASQDSNQMETLESNSSKHGASPEHASSFDQYSRVLTRGHHGRFRKLLSCFGMNANSNESQTKSKRKEFQTLCELFRDERRLYSTVLRQYCIDNAERFHLGFKIPCNATQFVDIRSKYIHSYKKARLNSKASEARFYGPCIQTISINRRSNYRYSGIRKTGDEISAQITLIDTLSPKLVFQRTVGKPLPVLNVEKLRELFREGTCIRAAKRLVQCCPESFLLCEDLDAKRLAEEWNVQVVLTDWAMMSLMKESKWILPLSQKQIVQSNNRSKAVVFIEDPLPLSCCSRECLSFGLIDSLYGSLRLDLEPSNSGSRQYNYTLLNFVGASSFRVLVRSESFILNEDGGPLSIDVSLEYFPDRGMEVIPVRDRTQWLVQKILNPKAKQLLFRIDPETANILSMEEKGVADVLTSEDAIKDEKGVDSLGDFESMEDDTSPDELIQCMMDLCCATTKLNHNFSSRNIVCFPARYQGSTSVASHQVASVHKETNDEDASFVDIMKEIDDAHQVHLAPTYRNWSWDHDRMPFTFPWKDDDIFTITTQTTFT
eukprot:CAMPEP_0176495978 /NCGR_PEP_ID=MMETSP0200_2-20121128/10952_1 /TAXON_ID=947934 /ORGANISM="Chaetoceros sp., Strain GSL56" /LENGTH=637 /DNA_ID=CAMNT_0017893907 /DNA_START=159 /DNA_END=2072 /DNA_ORIENTATION=-